MTLPPFAFLTGISYDGLVLGLIIFWIPGFFISRIILRKTLKPKSITMLSLIVGLLISPILFGAVFALLVWSIYKSENG